MPENEAAAKQEEETDIDKLVKDIENLIEGVKNWKPSCSVDDIDHATSFHEGQEHLTWELQSILKDYTK